MSNGNGGEESLQEKAHEKLEKGEIEFDSDKSLQDQVSDSNSKAKQREASSQASQDSADADITAIDGIIVIGRLLVVGALGIVGLVLLGNGLGFWRINLFSTWQLLIIIVLLVGFNSLYS